MKRIAIVLVNELTPFVIAATSVVLIASGFRFIQARLVDMGDHYQAALVYAMGGTLIIIGGATLVCNAIYALGQLEK